MNFSMIMIFELIEAYLPRLFCYFNLFFFAWAGTMFVCLVKGNLLFELEKLSKIDNVNVIVVSQPVFTCSKSAMETPDQYVKSFQYLQKKPPD